MVFIRVLTASVLILMSSLRVYSDDAKAAFDRAARAEKQGRLDAAYESFKRAYFLKPKNARYLEAYLRSRASAGEAHIRQGLQLRDEGKLEEALDGYRGVGFSPGHT